MKWLNVAAIAIVVYLVYKWSMRDKSAPPIVGPYGQVSSGVDV
jgi:hypothetical protein